MPHVFLSYSHQDAGYARRIATSLARRSIDCWMDDDIEYGDEWPAVVDDHLDNSVALILIMTRAAKESRWVAGELSRARIRGIPIFPLLLSGKPFPGLARLHYVDVVGGRPPQAEFYKQLALRTGQTDSGETKAKLLSAVDWKVPTAKEQLATFLTSGVDFSGIDLSGRDLSAMNLRSIDLRGANLRGANLSGANLIDANLGGADLSHAKVIRTNLTWANLQAAQLNGAQLVRARLVGTVLVAANLSYVWASDREEALRQKYGTDLTDADPADLAIPIGYVFPGTLGSWLWEQRRAIDATLPHEAGPLPWSSSTRSSAADLTEADLTRADLTNADLTGATLTRARFDEADLTKAKLTDADLTDVVGFELARRG
ncbi:MAG TPA: pentapeptide repeat-containing protein [Pseudonocardiaceae bacterium]